MAQACSGILSFKRQEVGPFVVHAMHFGILEQACAQSEGFIILGKKRSQEKKVSSGSFLLYPVKFVLKVNSRLLVLLCCS